MVYESERTRLEWLIHEGVEKEDSVRISRSKTHGRNGTYNNSNLTLNRCKRDQVCSQLCTETGKESVWQDRTSGRAKIDARESLN